MCKISRLTYSYFIIQAVPEQVVLLLVQDNLDIACSAIEKAAMERAVADVDEGFATEYELRRRHRLVCVSLRLLSIIYT